MILYIDMDGVIADFEKGVKNIEPNMEWTKEEVDRVCEANPHVFETLPWIEGAKEAIDVLKDYYTDIYFLSTPMCNIPESYTGKRKWIQKYFGEWADKRLILTHRKDLCIGDILIDDRLKNGSESFKGKHIHFGQPEFPNWESVLKYLIL